MLIKPLAAALLLTALSLHAQEADLRPDTTRQSLSGTHRHYRQYLDGIEVVGGGRTETIRNDGTRRVFDRLAQKPILRQALATGSMLAAPTHGARLVYLNLDGEARLAWETLVQEKPIEVFARYTDAATGEVLRVDPLFFNVAARVFQVNPVATLNNPSLQDQNNSATAVPDSAYTTVDLAGLAASGPLVGPNVTIADLEAPSPTPVDVSQSLMFDRSQSGFEEVNAYYHIDRAQRYLQSLGYVGEKRIIDYSIPVDAHAGNGTDNSYYLSSAVTGHGSLYFGDGGTDDAEDPDIMLHEYGHAIQDWIDPGTFNGSHASQARAIGEGFGDYWSFSQNYTGTIASGRDPFCFADWDARCAGDDASQNCGYKPGADCLRRVDGTKTIANYSNNDTSGTEHANGEIWSSALREIFIAATQRYGVDVGKRIVDTLVIESHFGVPPNPTFAVLAQNLLDADRVLYSGINSSVICNAMTLRGILTVGDCDPAPRGERTLEQSPDHGIPIPDDNPAGIVSLLTITDTRAIDKIGVHVNIAHTSRGDLHIVLVAPDGTNVLLEDASLDRQADVDATFGFDAQPVQPLDVLRGRSAAGQWKLLVSDRQPRDVGTLLSWSLVLQFSGDAPSSSRPQTLDNSRFIPAVAHAPGANGTNFVSSLTLYNRDDVEADLVMIFTPSASDGMSKFSAVKLVIPPNQVVTYDDVVAEVFQSLGTGNLELAGDIGQLEVASRTYTRSDAGTFGQYIPLISDVSSLLRSAPLVVTGLRNDDSFRTNLGIAATGSNAGTVRVTLFDAETGLSVSQNDYTIQPFSHVQFPVTARGRLVAEMQIVAGLPIIAGYGSVVDNVSGDPIFIPATHASTASQFTELPAISSAGARGTSWASDVWLTGSGTVKLTYVEALGGTRVERAVVLPGEHRTLLLMDIVGSLFGATGTLGTIQAQLPAGVFSGSRIATTTPTTTLTAALGTYGQFVPFAESDNASATALVTHSTSRDVLDIENSSSFRTNIGVFNLRDATTMVRVSLFNANGEQLQQVTRQLAPFELAQLPVTVPVVDGRVRVEALDADGSVAAYASLVDNATGDPTYVPAQ